MPQTTFQANRRSLENAMKEIPRPHELLPEDKDSESNLVAFRLVLGARTGTIYESIFRQFSPHDREWELSLQKPFADYRSDEEKGIWFLTNDNTWSPADDDAYVVPPYDHPDYDSDNGWAPRLTLDDYE